jgi:hypothetical protein
MTTSFSLIKFLKVVGCSSTADSVEGASATTDAASPSRPRVRRVKSLMMGDGVCG